MNNVHQALDQLLDALAARNRPVATHLRPGLSQEDIERRCLAAGVSLPMGLMALYQFCDGVESSYLRDEEFCLLSVYWLMPLDRALEQQATYKENAAYDLERGPDWFPFLYGEGDCYAVDPQAVAQQKPSVIRDMLEFWPEVMYTNVAAMFDTLAECYRQGAYPDKLGGENDELLIAQISASHNPDVAYWQERLRELSGAAD